MVTEAVYKIAIWYIPIYLILLLIPTIVLFVKEFRFLMYYAFDKLCLDWNPKIEKPRIFFAGIGYLFALCAWLTSKLRLGDIWFCTPLAVLFSIASVFTLYFILSKPFENKFIKYMKKQLGILGYRAIVNPKSHNIECVLNSLKSKYIKCGTNAFCDFISLNEIAEEDKIEWSDSITNLVRFIFILFDVKTDANSSLNHDPIRLIIQHYFRKDGKNIKLTETGSEISNVKKELDLDRAIFIDYKSELLLHLTPCKR